MFHWVVHVSILVCEKACFNKEIDHFYHFEWPAFSKDYYYQQQRQEWAMGSD